MAWPVGGKPVVSHNMRTFSNHVFKLAVDFEAKGEACVTEQKRERVGNPALK